MSIETYLNNSPVARAFLVILVGCLVLIALVAASSRSHVYVAERAHAIHRACGESGVSEIDMSMIHATCGDGREINALELTQAERNLRDYHRLLSDHKPPTPEK